MWWRVARVLRFMDPGRAVSPGRSEDPICSELFSAERMESHAESLAGAHTVAADGWAGRSDLPARVADNNRVLSSSYELIAEAARENRAITPAAEWLLDNFHVVEEQVRELERGLTPALLPLAARALRRAAGRLSSRGRPRMGFCGPHRQPVRSRAAGPVHQCLPARDRAFDPRNLGRSPDPALDASRESAADGGARGDIAGGAIAGGYICR